MRRRRSQNFGDEVAELLRKNTFGGSKEERHAKKSLIPIISTENGIKIEWDGHAEDYPPIVKLKMTDGSWITYQIKVELPKPVISPALEELANMKRGYPPERS